MKIRRKRPKPAAAKLPAFVIGFTGLSPSPREIQMWFDLDYGGPLKWSGAGDAALAAHTSWQAAVSLELSSDEAAAWAERAGWTHPSAATVIMPGGPRPSTDLVLHAARLARGLTLLTQGTSFDVATGGHANPSDWTDRRLDRFVVDDHVAVIDADSDDGRQWLFTRGLKKFGLDELEFFHPQGLPTPSIHAMLLGAAAELIVHHASTNVGATLALGDPPLTLRIARHRTVSLADGTLIVRELQRAEKSVT